MIGKPVFGKIAPVDPLKIQQNLPRGFSNKDQIVLTKIRQNTNENNFSLD